VKSKKSKKNVSRWEDDPQFVKWFEHHHDKLTAGRVPNIHLAAKFVRAVKDIFSWFCQAGINIGSFKPEKAMKEAEKFIAEHKRIVHRFEDGYFIKELERDELRAEGERMGNCIHDYRYRYDSNEFRIYSLRDKKNKPHVTLEIDPDGNIVEFAGKQNETPIPKYMEKIIAWKGKKEPDLYGYPRIRLGKNLIRFANGENELTIPTEEGFDISLESEGYANICNSADHGDMKTADFPYKDIYSKQSVYYPPGHEIGYIDFYTEEDDYGNREKTFSYSQGWSISLKNISQDRIVSVSKGLNTKDVFYRSGTTDFIIPLRNSKLRIGSIYESRKKDCVQYKITPTNPYVNVRTPAHIRFDIDKTNGSVIKADFGMAFKSVDENIDGNLECHFDKGEIVSGTFSIPDAAHSTDYNPVLIEFSRDNIDARYSYFFRGRKWGKKKKEKFVKEVKEFVEEFMSHIPQIRERFERDFQKYEKKFKNEIRKAKRFYSRVIDKYLLKK